MPRILDESWEHREHPVYTMEALDEEYSSTVKRKHRAIKKTEVPVEKPPAPGKLTSQYVAALGQELLGKYAYEDVFAFALTFLHLREVDRHLSDLNGMRRDIEWLERQLGALRPTDESPQRATWSAMLAWLREEEKRHHSALTHLHNAIANAKGLHPKAAAAAEKVARPTFGQWLELAPPRLA